jgi:hypothetical protein
MLHDKDQSLQKSIYDTAISLIKSKERKEKKATTTTPWQGWHIDSTSDGTQSNLPCGVLKL